MDTNFLYKNEQKQVGYPPSLNKTSGKYKGGVNLKGKKKA